jgi:hypothetical protein
MINTANATRGSAVIPNSAAPFADGKVIDDRGIESLKVVDVK